MKCVCVCLSITPCVRPTNRPKRYRYESERHDNDKRRTKGMERCFEKWNWNEIENDISTKGICGAGSVSLKFGICDKRSSFFIH